MGIPGLLPVLKSIEKQVSLEEYRGKILAIDGYSWLHKSTVSCAQDLCLGVPTKKLTFVTKKRCLKNFRFVGYFMERIRMLDSFGVIPYVVLDGGYLPMKAQEEADRKRFRRFAVSAEDLT
jgi:exonuclease-1